MIKDMTVGMHISEPLVLTQATKRMTKGIPPRPFLACTFSDGWDNISGNIWNYTEETLPEVKKVYIVDADVGEYNGTKQLNSLRYRTSPDQSMSAFNKVFGCDGQVNAAWDGIAGYARSLQSAALKQFIDELVLNQPERWHAATSAVTMHHVGMGGNVVHTYEVMVLADSMAHMATELGYAVAQDLVIAGAIIHDVGKLYTYRVDGPACEMTTDGIMADHIAIGTRMLWDTTAAQQYPNVARLLEHIILSHHGKLEYGSPVLPRMIEAEIVARADGLSAALAMFAEADEKAISEKRPGALTERVYALGNSQLPRRSFISSMLQTNEPF